MIIFNYQINRLTQEHLYNNLICWLLFFFQNNISHSNTILTLTLTLSNMLFTQRIYKEEQISPKVSSICCSLS